MARKPVEEIIAKEIVAPIVQTLNQRITRLEDAITVHLTESGEIRNDIKWIKKSFWACVTLGSIFCAGVLLLLFKMVIHVQG